MRVYRERGMGKPCGGESQEKACQRPRSFSRFFLVPWEGGALAGNCSGMVKMLRRCSLSHFQKELG